MSETKRISAGQFFALLYISRMVVNVTYSRYHSDITQLKYGVYGSITSLFFTLIMLIPVHILLKTGNDRNILDSAFAVAKPFSVGIAVIYGTYFLWVAVNTVSFFDTMSSNVFNPNLSVTVLSAVGILSVIYGACQGIQTLGRSSTIFALLIGIALIILTLTLIPKADFLNLEMLSAENIPDVAEMTFSAIAKNSCIPAMTLLLPLVDGNKKKCFCDMGNYGISFYRCYHSADNCRIGRIHLYTDVPCLYYHRRCLFGCDKTFRRYLYGNMACGNVCESVFVRLSFCDVRK